MLLTTTRVLSHGCNSFNRQNPQQGSIPKRRQIKDAKHNHWGTVVYKVIANLIAAIFSAFTRGVLGENDLRGRGRTIHQSEHVFQI